MIGTTPQKPPVERPVFSGIGSTPPAIAKKRKLEPIRKITHVSIGSPDKKAPEKPVITKKSTAHKTTIERPIIKHAPIQYVGIGGGPAAVGQQTVSIGQQAATSTQQTVGIGQQSQNGKSATAIIGKAGKVVGHPPFLTFFWQNPLFQAGIAAYNQAKRVNQDVSIGTQISTYVPLSQEVVQDYQRALAYFVQVYKDANGKQLPIDGKSSSNYVVMVMKSMFLAFLDNLRGLKTSIIKHSAQGQSYELFMKELEKQAARYTALALSSKELIDTNREALYVPFEQAVAGLLISVYAFALNDMANSPASSLKMHALTQAQHYFNQAQKAWSSQLQVPGFATAQDALTAFSVSMGSIAYTVFRNILNGMTAQSDVTTIGGLISAQNKNVLLLNQALPALQAAFKTYSALADSKSTALAALYGGMYTNLESGIATLVAARGSALADQVQLINQASTQLAGGGALWYSQHLNRALNSMEGNAAEKEGRTTLKGWSSTYSELVKKTKLLINSIKSTAPLDLSSVFSDLAQACSNAVVAYKQADALYQAASLSLGTPSVNGPLLAVQQQITINKQLALLANQALLQDIKEACTLLVRSIDLLKSSPQPEQVLQIQGLVSSALTLSTQADTAYKQLHSTQGAVMAQTAFPFYSLFAEGLTPFIAQYIAYCYQVLAEQMPKAITVREKGLKATYYQAAFFYQSYLNPILQQSLINRLKDFKILVSKAENDLAQAQAQDSAAKSAHTAPSTEAWDRALNATFIVYTLWKVTEKSETFKQGPSLYRACLEQYAQSYTLEKQADNDILQLLLRYRLYLLETAEASPSPVFLSELTSVISTLFAQGHALAQQAMAEVVNGVDGYQKSIAAFEQLAAWQEKIDALVRQSQQAFEEQRIGAPALSREKFALISNQQGTYASPLIAQITPLALANLALRRAQLYGKQGDWAIARALELINLPPTPLETARCSLQNNLHGVAAYAYFQARRLYLQLGNSTLAQTMAAQANSEEVLAIADLVGNAPRVAWSDAEIFADFLGSSTPVYGQYFLSPWLAEIPASLPIVPAQLITDYTNYNRDPGNPQLKAAVIGDLKDLAAALYLFQHIQAGGLIKLFSGDYLAAIQDSNFAAGISDTAVAQQVTAAQAYRQKLTQWVGQGIPLKAGNFIKTSLTFLNPPGRLPALVYCNIPVEPVPWGQSPLQAIDPTAVIAYAFALKQYQGFKGVMPAQQNYSQAKIALLQNSIQQAYLSEAYALLQKARYMQSENIDTTLLSLLIVDEQERLALEAQRAVFTQFLEGSLIIENLDDTTNKNVVALTKAVSIVQDYYSLAATYAATAAAPSSTTGKGLHGAQGVTGYLFEKQASLTESVLVGKPTASQYQAYLSQAYKLYATAQGAYQQANFQLHAQAAQVRQATMFATVARTYNQQGSYLASLRYFNTAQQLYQNAATAYQQLGSPLWPSLQQKSLLMGLEGLTALFQGATELFVKWYAMRWSNALSIAPGQTESFEQLLADCASFAATDQEGSLCQQLNSLILDALIYLTAVESTISQEALSGGITLVSVPATLAGKAKTAATEDPALKAYLESHLPLDAAGKQIPLAKLLLSGSLKASAVKDLLNGLLLGGQTNELGSLTLAQNKTALAQALSITQKWSDYLFQAIAANYIQTYLSDVCAQGITSQCIENQYGDLIDAMKGEEQNIIAPAQQYVG